MRTIKEILTDAKRYDDVISILSSIIADNRDSYAVNAFIDQDNQVKWNVVGCEVRLEAYKLLCLINEDKCIGEDICVVNLASYVNTCTDTMLHNYAVSLSHRADPYIDMEAIRSWEILDNLLMCWNLDLEADDSEWYIPEGWKRVPKDEEEKK